MSIGFRPTQEDLCIIEANRREGEKVSDVIRRALRLLDRNRDRLCELVEWLEEEHGPLEEDERSAAIEEMEGLDAEHEGRRGNRGTERERLRDEAAHLTGG